MLATQKITNEVTALFMGEMDFKTGIWFPIKKMTWEENHNGNYLNCSIHYVKGAENYQSLYPGRKNLFLPRDITRVMKYDDICSSAWNNRMPVARSLKETHKQCLGFDLSLTVDPVAFVIRDGGYRNGDLCNIFPEISPDENGNFNFIFRGIDVWRIASKNKPELESIPVGAKVTLNLPEQKAIFPDIWEDPMNTTPPEGIRMKMYVEEQMVGYAPNYIIELHKQFQEHLNIEIFRVNLGVPFEYQFLFLATLDKKVGTPFSESKYQLTAN